MNNHLLIETVEVKPNGIMLREAAVEGHIRQLEIIIAAGVDINEPSPSCGGTALMAAISGRKTECVKFLLNNKADPNIKNNEGLNALYHAAKLNDVDCVEMLVKVGADINVLTMKNSFAKTPLMVASFFGSNKVVKALVDLGADLNIISGDGKSATEIAEIMGNRTAIHIIRTASSDNEIKSAIANSTSNEFEEHQVTRKRGPTIF